MLNGRADLEIRRVERKARASRNVRPVEEIAFV